MQGILKVCYSGQVVPILFCFPPLPVLLLTSSTNTSGQHNSYSHLTLHLVYLFQYLKTYLLQIFRVSQKYAYNPQRLFAESRGKKSEAIWEMSILVSSMLKQKCFRRKDPEPAQAGTAGVRWIWVWISKALIGKLQRARSSLLVI